LGITTAELVLKTTNDKLSYRIKFPIRRSFDLRKDPDSTFNSIKLCFSFTFRSTRLLLSNTRPLVLDFPRKVLKVLWSKDTKLSFALDLLLYFLALLSIKGKPLLQLIKL